MYSGLNIVKAIKSFEKGKTNTVSVNLNNPIFRKNHTLVAKEVFCNKKITNNCGLEVGSVIGEKNLFIECLKMPTENCGEAEFRIENVGDRDYMRFTLTFYDKSNTSNDERHIKKIGFVPIDRPKTHKLDLTMSTIKKLDVRLNFKTLHKY